VVFMGSFGLESSYMGNAGSQIGSIDRDA
jgi:hypothetical protein